ncbi:MAG: homoserine dehydrogenase [Candidatus Poribacteria bacterium]|nr:homoserine dehydrogenase [Candidatus Poribacteria bacterium]
MEKSEVNVGLLGWGTVGKSVSKILLSQHQNILKKSGINLNLTRIAKRTMPVEGEGIDLPNNCLTTDPSEVVNGSGIDVVVELIGGVDTAFDLVTQAMENGKHVVTANKALLAERGAELFQLANQKGVFLGFEASTAGGIPIIKALRESFSGNQIQSMHGIINGTCNYILTQMHDQMTSFDVALASAQEKGYAEADPTLDIEGIDAAHKLSILSSLAYSTYLPFDKIYVEGITKITDKEIQYAREFGYVIKLLAIAKMTDSGIEARVHPALIPERSILANVSGAFNGVYLVGDAVGPTLFYGQGAGGMPTASAVVADIIEASQAAAGGLVNLKTGGWIKEESSGVEISSIAEVKTRYYMRLVVRDQPSVLAEIGQALGDCQISIAAVTQKAPQTCDTVSLVIITHKALEKNMDLAREKLSNLEVVGDDFTVIRIEELDFDNT